MAGFDDCVLYLSVSLIEMVCISDDVDLKPEGVFISPPPSDSGSSSPQLSPYCIDSEPGSPLLEHETVRHADPAPSINFLNRAQTPPPHFIFSPDHRLHPSLNIYIRPQTPPLTSYSNNSTESAPSFHIQSERGRPSDPCVCVCVCVCFR